MRELLPPLLHERTAVLTLQNGLGSDELVARLFGAERVLGGLCFVCLNRVTGADGALAIECYHPGSVSLGELGRPATDRPEKLAILLGD